MVGARVIVTGYVYNTNCQPVANAWLDFWEANYYGQYDNTGYTLRGHEYTEDRHPPRGRVSQPRPT